MTLHPRLALLAVVPAAMLALAGCDKTIDSGDLENKLSENIKQQAGQSVTADCPSDIKAKKGKTFDCTITLQNGNKVKAKVTLEDDNGKFSYTVAQ